jgi:hypothetical protein
MIKQRGLLFAAIAACLVPGAELSAQVGEPAAPIKVSEWVKGKPVEVKPGTNIFVVEIFTTWSLASQASITNLNAIQTRFKDKGVVVVAVTEEPAERIKQFLQREGAKIEYTVASDDRRHTSLGYMMPIRQQGVPCTFVVGKDGKLLWHGHPERGLSTALEQIVAGTYDLKAAVEAEKARKQMIQYLEFAQKRDPRTKTAGRMLLTEWTNNLPMLCQLAFNIATTPKLVTRDVQLASEALDRAEQLSPTNTTRAAATRAVLLFETGHREEGLAQAREAVAKARDPVDKANAESSLRSLEARTRPTKRSPTRPTGTNAVPRSAGNP